MYFNVYDPTERHRRLPSPRQPRQRGLRRADDVPLPARRARRVHVQAARDHDNDAFDAGGMRFEVITPFEELRTTYDGKVVLLDEPLQMANPRQAFTENPWVDAHVDLAHRGVVTDVRRRAGERRRQPADARTTRAGSRAATTSSTWRSPARSASATRSGSSNGFGLRDHSWGPRFWQAPWYYRWLTANFGDDFGLRGLGRSPVTRRQPSASAAMVFARRRVRAHPRPRRSTPTGRATTSTTRRCTATATTGDRHLRDHAARVLNLIPLRNRRTDTRRRAARRRASPRA